MSNRLKGWFGECLKIGYGSNLTSLEKSKVTIVNGLSLLVLVVCIFHTAFFIYIDVDNKWQTLLAVPLYLFVFWLNQTQRHKYAQAVFTYGTYLLISFWAFQNRRTGADYGLIALATSIALIESSRIRSYLFFTLCIITYLVYKVYDFNTPFEPDPAQNYDLVQNTILFSSGAIIFIQMMIFRNLTDHFADEANSKYNQLQRALDIKKQTEEKLKTSNKDLQQLKDQLEWIVKQKTAELQTYLDAININIYSSITDLQGNLVKVNEPMMQLSGYTAQELIGKNIKHLDEKPDDAVYQEIEHTILQGNTWRGELKLKGKHGVHYWTDQVIIPIKGRGNKVSYALTLALPITERKQNEEARENTLKMLESIAFKTSHKVRGPLARIQGLVSLIQTDLIGQGEIKSVTKNMGECCTELNNATSDLVKFVNDHYDNIEQVQPIPEGIN